MNEPVQHLPETQPDRLSELIVPLSEWPSLGMGKGVDDFALKHGKVLLDASETENQAIIDAMVTRFNAAMGPLNEAQKRTYTQLSKRLAVALSAVETKNEGLVKSFETQWVSELGKRIHDKTSVTLDPKKTWFHTEYVEVLDGSRKIEKAGVNYTGFKGRLYHVQSMTLWQAACMNFGFGDVIDSTLAQNSWVDKGPGRNYAYGGIHKNDKSVSLIPTDTVIDIVRDLDLGTRLEGYLGPFFSPGGEMFRLLREYSGLELKFSLYEAYRLADKSGVDEAVFKEMLDLLEGRSSAPVSGVSIQAVGSTFSRMVGTSANFVMVPLGAQAFVWATQETRRALSEGIELPLVVFELKQNAGYCSYFPNRPESAFLYHPTQLSIRESFIAQVRKDRGKKLTLGWLIGALCVKDQFSLWDIVGLQQRPTDMDWLSGALYDAMHWVVPKATLDDVEFLYRAETSGPTDVLCSFFCKRYRSNLSTLAVKKSARNWESVQALSMKILLGLFDLLLIPLPGGLSGMMKIITVLLLAALAYNLYQGIQVAYEGQSAQLVGALVDIANLFLMAKIFRYAAHLGQQRFQELFLRLGYPPNALNGRQSWRPRMASYASVKHGLSERFSANRAGLFIEEGHHYGRFQADGTSLIGRLEFDEKRPGHVLVHESAHTDRPLMTYEPTLEHWREVLPAQADLSDVQRLKLMLADPISDTEAQMLLSFSSSPSATFDAAWGGGRTPSGLAEGVRRLRLDQGIEELKSALPARQPLSVEAAKALFSVLTEHADWPSDTALLIKNEEGRILEGYGKKHEILKYDVTLGLTQLDAGGYIEELGRTTDADHEKGVLALILELLPRYSRMPASGFAKPAAVIDALTHLSPESRNTLFEALSLYSNRLSSDTALLDHPTNGYLPFFRGDPAPHIVDKLEGRYPEISLSRWAEVLCDHPLSGAERRAFLDSGQLPELFKAHVARVREQVRVEQVIDGVYHTRVFDPHTAAWAAAAANALTQDTLGRRLEVIGMKDDTGQVPYVSTGPGDDTLVLLQYADGLYAPHDVRSKIRALKEAGPDSFYKVLAAQLSPTERGTLGMKFADDVMTLRRLIAQRLVSRLTPEGTLSLWTPGADPYADDVDLREVEADEHGLYRVGTHTYLPLEEVVYHVEYDPGVDQWQIRHPSRAGAYAPELEHNGAGAWQHEYEQPQEWEGPRLFRRLGKLASSFSDTTARQLMEICDVSEDQLRKVHVTGSRAPGLLMDTLQRFAREGIDQPGGVFKPDPPPVEPELDATAPLRALVQRLFPSLPELVARDVIEHASFEQRRQMRDSAKLPLALAEEARWWVQDVRLSRALEGLYVPSLASVDSRRLTEQLTKQLPETERQALTDPAKAVELRAALIRLALDDRAQAKRLLGMQPEIPGFKPPQRLADGKVGYELSGGQGRREKELKTFQTLYPGYSYAEAVAALARLGPDEEARAQVMRQRDIELKILRADLWRWRYSGAFLGRSVPMHQLAKRLKMCWRRKAFYSFAQVDDQRGYLLDLEGLAVERFPLLSESVDFSHVTELSLRGMGLSQPRFLDYFLARFESLQVLTLADNHFTHVPRLGVCEQYLPGLDLSGNQIVFSAAENQHLSRLSELRTLDLCANPLGEAPSLNNLHLLETLHLRDTQIMSWPRFIETLRNLREVDLSHNQLQSIPDGVFEAFIARHNLRINLSDNPLSVETLSQVHDYRMDASRGAFIVLGEDHTLPSDIELWLNDCPPEAKAALQANWSALRAEMGGERFLRFIMGLRALPGFFLGRNRALRGALVEQVRGVLAAASRDEEVREELFNVVLNGTSNRHSRSETFRGLIKSAVYHSILFGDLAQMRQGMFIVVRSWLRYDMLKELVAAQRLPDGEGTMRLYVSALQDMGLPMLSTDDFLFPDSRLHLAEVEAMRQQLLLAEPVEGFLGILSSNEYWQKCLERTHADDFAVFLDERPDLEPQENESSEEYRVRVQAAQGEYELAYEQWVAKWTQADLPLLMEPVVDPEQD